MEKNLIKITYIGYNWKKVIMCVLIFISLILTLTIQYLIKDNSHEDIIEDMQTFMEGFAISFVILLVILIMNISGIKHKIGTLFNSLYILLPLLCIYTFSKIEPKYYSDWEYIWDNKNNINYFYEWVPFFSVFIPTVYIILFQSKIEDGFSILI